MQMAKRGTIGIDKLTENFFVRSGLNDDHVIHLASLYEGGTKLPPIKITRENNIIVDGRHRIAALRLLDKKAVDVEWIDKSDKVDLLVDALRSNIGGPLPPTNADITFTIRQMLEHGATQSLIMKELSNNWPPAVVRRFYSDAQSALTKERVMKAKTAIIERNMTVLEAAAEFKIKPDILKAAMMSSKKKRASSAEIKGLLTTIFRSRGASMGMAMRKVLRQLEDGDLSWKSVEQILQHLEKCTKSTVQSARDWERRLLAAKK